MINKPGNKPKKNRQKSKSKEEQDHLNWLASRGCCICNAPANIHHIREFGESRDHFKTIPLCHFHHQGSEGIHYLGKREWRKRYGHENDYLKDLNEKKNNYRNRSGS